jgi:hypothetical protein
VGLQDARAAASGYRAAVAEGADPALVKSVAKKVETVDQMLDRFLTDHSAPGPRWKAEMRRVLAHDVRPAIGAYKINKVCKADIIALLNTIRDRGAGVQANRALQVVRKAFNWAASEDYLTDSPASGIAETRQGGTPVPSSVKSGDSGILAGPGQHWRRVYQAQLRCGEAPCAGRKRGRPSWNGLPRDHQLRT